MPVSVQWDNESKTIIYYEFSGKWTWVEYREAINTAVQMVEDLPYIVNMILDFRNTGFLPENALSVFGSSVKKPAKDFDLAVVVTNSSFIIAVHKMFQRIYNKFGEKIVTAKTLAEARVLLAEYDRQRTPANRPAALSAVVDSPQ